MGPTFSGPGKAGGAAPASAMLSAIAMLQGEHGAFASALQTMGSRLAGARALALKPSLAIFATGLSFIETFVDHFHHPKEDEFLFRVLRQRTGEADEAMRELQFEHATSPQMMEGLKSSLDDANAGGMAELELFATALDEYSRLQLAHIETEDNVVMPIAQRTLEPRDWEVIDGAFRANRDPLFSIALGGRFGGLFGPVPS